MVDPNKAINQVENFHNATVSRSRRPRCARRWSSDLDHLLGERKILNESLQRVIDAQTEPWGIKVTTVEIKDVEIPGGMQKAMARQAEAERERRAKIINSEGEFQAAERLKDAAIVLEEHPMALQLRYLQTLIEISGTPSTTVVFPAPIDIIKPFLERARQELIARAAARARSASRRRGSKSSCRLPSRSSEDRAHPERERALDVVRDRVADHRGVPPARHRAGRARRGRSTRVASSGRDGRS